MFQGWAANDVQVNLGIQNPQLGSEREDVYNSEDIMNNRSGGCEGRQSEEFDKRLWIAVTWEKPR